MLPFLLVDFLQPDEDVLGRGAGDHGEDVDTSCPLGDLRVNVGEEVGMGANKPAKILYACQDLEPEGFTTSIDFDGSGRTPGPAFFR